MKITDMKKNLMFIICIYILGNTMIFAQNSGDLDATFNSGTGPNAAVWSMVIQTDGKIIIGGSFPSYNGIAVNRIARLNANGLLDTSFKTGTGVNSYINIVALQTDGKILIGGAFTSFNGTPSNYIARLNTNGTLDTSFSTGTGLSSNVSTIAIQPDGKILIGGQFTSYNGTTCNRIARLNPNGTIDTSFHIGTGANSYVEEIALQTDGKILIAGSFTNYNGIARNHFTRLNKNGSLDTTFANVGGNSIHVIRIQPDGKILTNGRTKHINRFNSNGTLDNSFNQYGTGAGGDLPNVSDVALQADGRIVISGYFSSYNGITRKRIARLNPNGSLDTTFNPGMVYFSQVTSINSITIESNEKIIIGGLFTNYNGTIRNNLVRLYNCIGSQSIDLHIACNSYTWIDGNTYTASNSSAFQIISGGASNGCDSILFLNLTINPIGRSTDTHIICEGDSLSWIDGNTYYSSNSSATHPLIGGASNGCDSIITLQLIVNDNPTPTIIVENGIELKTQLYSSYQWLYNNNFISGATAQNYIATQNGNYNVLVNDNNGCNATSPSVNVTLVGIEEIENIYRNIKVYPNPTNEFLNIDAESAISEIIIINSLGEIVFEQIIPNSSISIDTRNLTSGIYFVKIGNSVVKFIKI